MSSYWAAYYGTALVLSEEEYVSFLNSYAEHHDIAREKMEEDIAEEGLRNYPFVRSKPTEADVTFEITEILTDDCDGMRLVPYRTAPGDSDYKLLRWHNCFVVFSDKYPGSMLYHFSGEKAYESYDDLVTEFKDKLSAYLPEDFDWDTHIGVFDYAMYA